MAIMVDLDGSLCRGAQRLHLMPPPEKRGDPLAWEPFHMACGGDTEVYDVACMLHAMDAQGYLLIFVSYRSESTRALTKDWLWRHGFKVSDLDLVLREGNSGQPAHVFKLEKIRQLERERNLKFIFAIEDDLPVCQYLRAHDIPCYQVRDWERPMPSEKVAMPTYHAADKGPAKATSSQYHLKEFMFPIRNAQGRSLFMYLMMRGVGPVPDSAQEVTLDLLAAEDWLDANLDGVRKDYPEVHFPRMVSTIMASGQMTYPGDSDFGARRGGDLEYRTY